MKHVQMGNKNTNLGILAQVSAAQAMAFSFPHQETALQTER